MYQSDMKYMNISLPTHSSMLSHYQLTPLLWNTFFQTFRTLWNIFWTIYRVYMYMCLCSFIHSGDLYNASSRDLLLRGAPSPVTDKKEGLQRDVKFGRVGRQQGT